MNKNQSSQSLIIIDGNKFRRAAITSLLAPWAECHSMAITPVCAEAVPGAFGEYPAIRLILINLGGDRASNPLYQQHIREVSAGMPDIPVVIFADAEDRDDVVAAFDGGAQGFLPTSLDPEVALHALSFIFKGGSFFPASVLGGTGGMRQIANRRPEDIGTAVALEAPPQASTLVVPRLVQMRQSEIAASEPPAPCEALTERQQRVLELLSTGLSNKMIARQLEMTEATVKVHVRHVMRKLGAANRTEAAIIAMNFQQERSGGAAEAGNEVLSAEEGWQPRQHRISFKLQGRFVAGSAVPKL